MCYRSLLSWLGRVLVPLACLTTLVLYTYPVFQGCVFPSKNGSILTAIRETVNHHIIQHDPSRDVPTSAAPFRLLVLADPQLEGDSSLPSPDDDLLPTLRKHIETLIEADLTEIPRVLSSIARDILIKNIPDAVRGVRKRVDLFGNDYYLAHIYRTLYWWTKPSHVTVLGDLIGSQWVTDEEFEWRGWRYWNRAFAGGQFVDENITTLKDQDGENVFTLGDEDWSRRLIHIAGNHDIGYAGDITEKRMERFERVFGKANWDIRFEYPMTANATDEQMQIPSIHLIVFNSLLLDTPAKSEELQTQTYDYLNDVITKRLRPIEDSTSFTLLLTHVPLHKKPGICIDAPHFDFWGDDDGNGSYIQHGLKEQNHLSDYISHSAILEGLFGMSGNTDFPQHGHGRNGLILTGHDHEGCDTFHYIPLNSTKSFSSAESEGEPKTQWDASQWVSANTSDSHAGLREVTLRSMMGEYGGNAGLLSVWFDFENENWKYDITMCKFGIQHYWWAVHIIDLIAIVVIILNILVPSKTSPSKTLANGHSQKKLKQT